MAMLQNVAYFRAACKKNLDVPVSVTPKHENNFPQLTKSPFLFFFFNHI